MKLGRGSKRGCNNKRKASNIFFYIGEALWCKICKDKNEGREGVTVAQGRRKWMMGKTREGE